MRLRHDCWRSPRRAGFVTNLSPIVGDNHFRSRPDRLVIALESNLLSAATRFRDYHGLV